MARITGADEHDVLFLVSPAMSSAGITQMHLFADRRAPLVLEDRFEPADSLAALEQRAGATMLGGAPVIAERLLHTAEASPQRHIALRTLALGGAMLPRPMLEQATDEFGIEIARVYGSSEASCATGSVPEDDREHRLADDGVLMPGTEVPVGSVNSPQEGLLRGPCVMLGYVDPDDDIAAFRRRVVPNRRPGRGARRTARGRRTAEGGRQPQRPQGVPGGDRCGAHGDARSRRVHVPRRALIPTPASGSRSRSAASGRTRSDARRRRGVSRRRRHRASEAAGTAGDLGRTAPPHALRKGGAIAAGDGSARKVVGS